MSPIPPTMKELREVCSVLGITPARSIAETEARIAAHHEARRDTKAIERNDMVDAMALAVENAKRMQAPSTMPDVDYSHIEQRAALHMGIDMSTQPDQTVTRRFVGKSPLLAAPYGRSPVQDALDGVAPGGVYGGGDAYRWMRSRPRQDVGPVSRYMVLHTRHITGKFQPSDPRPRQAPTAKGKPRSTITYRAFRRELAKQQRKLAQRHGAVRVPA